MSQQRGSHYLKFGAEYRYHVGIGIFPNLMNFNFYAGLTAEQLYLSPNTAVERRCATRHSCWASIDERSNARGYPFQTMHVPFIGTFYPR